MHATPDGDTGLRASEILNLRARDLDWTSGRLMVREGKGKKDRTLWVGERDLELLQAWQERQPSQAEHIFTTL